MHLDKATLSQAIIVDTLCQGVESYLLEFTGPYCYLTPVPPEQLTPSHPVVVVYGDGTIHCVGPGLEEKDRVVTLEQAKVFVETHFLRKVRL